MRGSGRVFISVLVLALCAAAGSAFAVGKEPVTGGLLALPGDAAATSKIASPNESPAPVLIPLPPPAPPAPVVPVPTPAAAPAATGKGDDTSWGVLLRGGYFGVPNFIADELFFQHPDIAGSSVGVEFRYYGEDGGRGTSSIGLAIDSATAQAAGEWQQHESDEIVTANGEISMLAFTITAYWSIFPSWYVHPYVGLGIGAAHVKGFYVSETERVDADVWAPVLHIPVGLAVELGPRFQLAIEGRFIDGIAIGGALQARF